MITNKPRIPLKVKKLIEKTETHIVSLIDACDSPIKEAGKPIVKAGGKRLRPLGVLLAAWPTRDTRKLISAAASVELLHIGSLVHDDLIDNSPLRRGIPVIHETFDDRIAICTGDNLFAQAFCSLTECENLDALKVLCTAVGHMSDGQLRELSFKSSDTVTVDDYMQMIYGKTAALFEASLGIGSIISDKNALKATELMGYGKSLGLAFQLVDDLLDLTGDSAVVGKPVGNDLRENTVTLPVMIALDSGLERGRIESISSLSSQSDVDRVIGLIKETGALDEVSGIITKYTDEAKEFAKQANCEMSGMLVDIADYLSGRIH